MRPYWFKVYPIYILGVGFIHIFRWLVIITLADVLLFVVVCKICQCNDNQSLEHMSAANSWNVVYMLVEIPKIHINWFILGKTADKCPTNIHIILTFCHKLHITLINTENEADVYLCLKKIWSYSPEVCISQGNWTQ